MTSYAFGDYFVMCQEINFNLNWFNVTTCTYLEKCANTLMVVLNFLETKEAYFYTNGGRRGLVGLFVMYKSNWNNIWTLFLYRFYLDKANGPYINSTRRTMSIFERHIDRFQFGSILSQELAIQTRKFVHLSIWLSILE